MPPAIQRLLSAGFEVETEIVIHAWELRIAVHELEAPYRQRPAASRSKLRAFRDGSRKSALAKFLDPARPTMAFFTGIAALLLGTALVLGLPLVTHYLATGLVPRLPSAVLTATLSLIAVVAFFAGVSLEATCQSRREIKRLAYLSIPASGQTLTPSGSPTRK